MKMATPHRPAPNPGAMPMVAAIPKAPPVERRRLLADLEARLARASEIAEAADAAGDAGKLRKAIERMALREEQIKYLTAMPADATCPRCDHGEEGWPLDLLVRNECWTCLPHSEDYINNRVAERMADLYSEEVTA